LLVGLVNVLYVVEDAKEDVFKIDHTFMHMHHLPVECSDPEVELQTLD